MLSSLRIVPCILLLVAAISAVVSAVDGPLRPNPVYEPQLRPSLPKGEVGKTIATDLARWEQVTSGLHAAIGSVDAQYDRRFPPDNGLSRQWNGTTWRGERVNIQAVLWTAVGAKQVRCVVSELSTEGGAVILASTVRCRFVRYVIADRPSGSGGGGCSKSSSPEDRYLVPDILDHADRLDLPSCSTRPVWITIDVPADTKPGEYRGQITMKAVDVEPVTVGLTLEVLNATVPPPTEWSFRMDLWQNPWAVAHHHGVKPFSDAHVKILEPHLKMLADIGQTFITTYITHDAWGESIYVNEGTMVEWVRARDGRWRFDYTNFDKYVELALRCGITDAITCYTPAPWKNRYRYLDEATGEYVHVRWSPTSKEFQAFWPVFLADLETHLKQRGWFERTYLGVNENPLPDTKAVIKAIKSANPKWKITYAGFWHPELSEVLDDYCTIIDHRATAQAIRQRRQIGQTTTFYVCCGPTRPNNFTFSPPAESAWMGWHAAAQGYDGFLRWAYDGWTADPLHDTRHTSFPAGDCWLVYPDCRSSIRFERLREGIVDYEKVLVLRARLRELGNDTAVQQLDSQLSHFGFKDAQDPKTTAKHLYAAKALMAKLARETFGPAKAPRR